MEDKTRKRMQKHSGAILMRQVYDHFKKSESIKHTHLPHSSVYYVRALIKSKFDLEMSLYEVENLLKELGMLTRGGNPVVTPEDIVRARKNTLRRYARKAGIYVDNRK